jgi:phenol 2-monooxygenase
MNVSMMDSYDLSWKLMYSLNELAVDPIKLLDTYEIDRRENAQNLIDFDKGWYTKLYKGSASRKDDATFITIEMGAFISGCGIEYEEGYLVERFPNSQISPVMSEDYWSGILREDRRLFDIRTFRFADGCRRHIHDDFPSDGRFRIMALVSTDLLDSAGRSATALTTLCSKIVPSFLPGFVELVIPHPLDGHSFEWTDVPECVKQTAEMRVHNAGEAGYAAYGVDATKGALVVVRPDGVVGTIAHLEDTQRVENYLRRILKV